VPNAPAGRPHNRRAQSEIGERIGYSQMHVSRLLRRALSRLEPDAAAA
jgi:DNA-directed RNA polymerase specialized sigma subunit